MIFKDIATQKNDSQKLADISLPKGKPNALWHELNETSEAAVSGGSWMSSLTVTNSKFTNLPPSPTYFDYVF
ncbi:hypothetical protein [Microcoleus sp. B3-A4]|uniref:hypothetical protein n=1 Tax=Microcoleus sp. B3-A4 TaxID=2818653 RepID=UPI002FD6E623